MHRILVHAHDSCACTRLLCMHKTPVHAQDSRFLCMRKILVHAEDSCACTRILTLCNLSTNILLFDSHILTRDPSRMVREGLRSLLDPLKNCCSHDFEKILGIGIAYCPCYSLVDPIGPVIPLWSKCCNDSGIVRLFLLDTGPKATGKHKALLR